MDSYENHLLDGENVKLVQRNNAIDISRILLDTSPETLHLHLEHVLKFESTQLFSSSESSGEQDELFNISPNFSHFSPFILPNSILSIIFNFLDAKDLESLEISSKSWKIALKRGFLVELEKEWLAPVKSRKMIEELTTAFGSSMLRYGYEWKQLWKYLESIKEKIGLMEALHEQMIGLIGFSHFSLISDTNAPEFATYQKSIVDWVRVASNTIIDALLEHRKESISLISGSGSLTISSIEEITSVEDAIRFRAQEMVKREDEAIVALLKQIDSLLIQWARSYCQTLVKTHLLPAIEDHKEFKQRETEVGKNIPNSASMLSSASDEDSIGRQNTLLDNDMQFMTDLLEIWRKVRCWEGVLTSLASPFASRLISTPIDFPISFGLELFNPRLAIRKFLMEMLWTDNTKSTVFTICMDVCDTLGQLQQNARDGDEMDYINSALGTLLELKSFFQIVSEPALADMVSRYHTSSLRTTSKPGNPFRLISRRYVWLKTRDGANFRMLVSHALRFSTISPAVERALSIGTAFGDDELDELIELGDCMVLKDDFHVLLLFSTFMDSLPSEYLEQATSSGSDGATQRKYSEEGMEAAAEFIGPFLTSPRAFAALLLASRQLNFDFLTVTMESLLIRA